MAFDLALSTKPLSPSIPTTLLTYREIGRVKLPNPQKRSITSSSASNSNKSIAKLIIFWLISKFT